MAASPPAATPNPYPKRPVPWNQAAVHRWPTHIDQMMDNNLPSEISIAARRQQKGDFENPSRHQQVVQIWLIFSSVQGRSSSDPAALSSIKP
ncbi:hypothetical protein ACLOJK_037138 [Asimina triloba]